MSNPVPRLRRLLAIIPLIQRRGGIPLHELQETLGVSKRELMGDLNAIMLCGVPPYLPNDYISVFIDGDHVTVDYAQHFARPARLTLPEALALRLAIERLPIPEEGPLYEAYLQVLETLEQQMRKSGQGNLGRLEGRIEAPHSQDLGDKLGVITAAVEQRQPLILTYYSASSDTITERRVRPYAQADKYGNQYLIGYCEQKQDVRSFRLDRISRLVLDPQAQPFAVPADFDLPRHLEGLGAGGFTVRLKFDAALSRYVSEDYAEMRVERADDAVTVVLNCGSIPWAVNKALLYGELCEITEPPEARDAICARLEAFLAESP
ncbi:MAG: WYL domain-containing protein [Planctomycetes bacterium]|nr:WYL domain-containing protein [Planctomycetota bacterium]